ncbi:DUF4163 domain-containing protein [Pseudobutyrivibrio ruminis]|uniref:DUF4163 domain-containing protein n=1 Tax=Pseudobutyrivibrio ruminis TaxID=46206 RepID=UPI00051B6F4A|nr:DUF4163 domain-containing protein [Pseudobutyrivibrio ruminis]
MKKSFICLMLAISMAFAITGCKKDEAKPEVSIQEKQTEAKTETTTEENKQLDDEYYFESDYDTDIFYTVDADGNKMNTYDRSVIKKILKDNGCDEDATIEAIHDGKLYLRQYATDDNGNSTYEFIALDLSTEKADVFFEMESSYWSNYSDFYDGKLYIAGINNDAEKFKEFCFVPSDDGTMTEDKDSETEIDGYSVDTNDNGRGDCIAREIDMFGYVELSSYDYENKRFATMDAEGNITELDALSNNASYVMAYNDKVIIYDIDDGDDYKSTSYVYNIETGKAKQFGDAESVIVIGVTDDKVYYATTIETDQYNVTTKKITEYDAVADTYSEMYESEFAPGASYADNVIFRAGAPYVIKLEGADVKWYRVDGADKLTDIDILSDTIQAYEYGTIIYGTSNFVCPYCGTPLYSCYAEAFVLDGKYSPVADQINAKLKEYMDGQVSYEPESVAEAAETDCEDHKEYPDIYHETDTYDVSGVNIINDRYLIVDFNGYWYGGGAHGMPSMYEYIFDLQTGEELTFADFYKGTEEEFKTLVAEKVRQDYLENSIDGDNGGYFAATDQDAYDTAYEYASINSGNVAFQDDKVLVYFYPYDLGSYADGFKFYEFSYQELFGTATMVR